MDFLPKPDTHDDLVSQVLRMRQQNAANQPGAEAIKAIGDVFGQYYQAKSQNQAKQNEYTQQVNLAKVRGDESIRRGQIYMTQPEIDNSPTLQGRGLKEGYYPKEVQINSLKPASATVSNNPTPEQMDAMKWGLRNNKISPNQMTFRGPKFNTLASMMQDDPGYQSYKKDPSKENMSYNAIQGDASLAGAKAGATAFSSERGRGKQDVGSAVSSVENTLPLVKEALPKVGSGGLKVITAAIRAGESQVNDPNLTELMGYLVALRGFYASMLKNGKTPDLASEAEAAKVISNQIDQKGFAGLEKFMRNEGQVRMKGVTQGFEQMQGAGKTQTQPQIPSGRVQVKGPDGKLYHIPQEQLQQAVKQGYQAVQ